MNSTALRNKFLKFFEDRGHVIIPSSPVVPENDPTVLFTTAGMHPLVPYLLGQPHSAGKRLVNYQKCVRTDDIEEVGDVLHHTFFEMLGNWSLGDYFKKEAITWSYEFLIQELSLDPNRIYVTCFAGDTDAPRDEESAEIWKSLGIPEDRIYFYGKKDNWWGPAGITGPCGPDTEMHYDVTQKPHGQDCKPGCSCGRFFEIWNDVFMQYNKTIDGKFEKLSKPNVDTGMGIERTVAVLNGLEDNYQTDIWEPIIDKISETSQLPYKGNEKPFRIIADHIRAAVFIISDGVEPSNKERGYILRRLLRRAAIQLNRLKLDPVMSSKSIAQKVTDHMSQWYPELKSDLILNTINVEMVKFESTLEKGLRQFNKRSEIDGKSAFDLFQTFGFPLELTLELASEKGIKVDQSEFKDEFRKHQELSRTSSKGAFKGGLADQSETVTKYHTATHLLHKALRNTLGDHVHQAGSNITSERLRFDFTHPSKLTTGEINQVEDEINLKIKENLPVTRREMKKEIALKEGALAFFPEKYPDVTSVYTVGLEPQWYSKELCGGPHVSSTGEIGKIKITKEESLGSGIRRIYAQFA
jgi:alanyl-tRNA synthetase